jgi:hypothetical protein
MEDMFLLLETITGKVLVSFALPKRGLVRGLNLDLGTCSSLDGHIPKHAHLFSPTKLLCPLLRFFAAGYEVLDSIVPKN